MKTKQTVRSITRHAFSLVEMLVVVTIVVLLLAFSAPALSRTLISSKLSSAGDTLLGAVYEAQQIAYANNLPVELRFFKFGDEFGGDNVAFRSYQMFKITQESAGAAAGGGLKEVLVPTANLVRLPSGIVIPDDEALSPAVAGDGIADSKPNAQVGYSGVPDAKYSALRFMPDGTCRKVGEQKTSSGFTYAQLTYQTLLTSFFTVTIDVGQLIKVENLPKDFYTIQIDPFTGKAKTYRPGF